MRLPVRRAVSLRPGQPIRQPDISATAVALSHDPEHESTWQLLGQCADGAAVKELEDGVASGNGLREPAGIEAGYQLLPDGLLKLAASASTQ